MTHAKTEPAAPTGLALLRAPFPEHQISKLPKETGAQAKQRKADQDAGKWPPKCDICGGFHHVRAVHLDYVGHAALTDRLLDADPAYVCEPMALGLDGLPCFDRNGGLWVRLTVCEVTRMGYGDADGKTGGNAVKEAIGDAMRNAAMRFGAALDLWHKGDLHLSDDGEARGDETPTPLATITESQRIELVGMLDTLNVQVGRFLQIGNISDLRELAASEFDTAKKWINQQAAKAA